MKRVVVRLALLGAVMQANNLQITNLSVNWAAQTVTFDISWENGWRLTTPPANWDAAWVFVKFRQCNAISDPWTHGRISTNLSDHIFPSQLEPVLSDGSAVGIDPVPNNLGVMLRHTNTGTFATVGPYTVTLKVTNLPTSGSYDIAVFGIEMVFIPEGAYLLGTLQGSYNWGDQAAYAFDQTGVNSSNNRQPYNITSENPIDLRWAGSGTNTSINVPAAFPKGYKAFHVMKYEISQGQYADFLNTLPSTTATFRYLGNFGTNRNRLQTGGTYPNEYQSNRPDRAQNFLSWHDLCAYLDWAALRPITEMEYEKICRGPGPSLGEYAWGTTNITAGTTIGITPENGTEVFTNPNANCTYNNVTYTGGDGGQGPVRVGIHAKVGSPSRQASGATYYGVLDMSGNVWEMVVMVSTSTGNIGSPAYEGNWGDGELDWATGRADQTSWPLGNPGGFGLRGGSWGNSWYDLRVSSRICSYPGHTCMGTRNPDARYNDAGGRGAR
jgi:formylglycine-generating enzyme required for sulfatase activity